VERYGRLGVEQGARLLAGGRRPDKPELAQGFRYLPTVFAEITPVREETFGQIITAERFDTEAEAVALGNDTEYGLAGAVSTRDLARGERVARLLRHGTLWINDSGPYLPSAEWSGFKRSGTGRRTRPVGPARVLRGQARVPQSQTGGTELVRPLAGRPVLTVRPLGGTRTVALRTVPLSRPPPQ
jgi:betaine-aldehyde dehydrogenase